MELFPAILIGGPPHMGKSVLIYSLSHALRERGVEHYALRAYPDGEGDWANEADQDLVRHIRVKGQGTPQWVDSICRDISARHLPLLVDVGGRPTPDQERIFDRCSHAILLTSTEADRHAWQAMLNRHGLIPIADLHSQLHGQDQITDGGPILRGVITGLERGSTASGPTFAALVERVARLFDYPTDQIRRAHLASAPVETTVDLDRLARTLGVPSTGEKATWHPHHLPAVLDYLPEAVPLGLYGRGPNWLYAAVALLAAPAPFVQFDVRLGWVKARSLPIHPPHPQSPLQFQSDEGPDFLHLQGVLPDDYLDYSQLDQLSLPPLPAGLGVVLSGKLPHWLITSLALTCRAAPWIGVYQPQLNCAVIVYSADQTHHIGDCLPIRFPT